MGLQNIKTDGKIHVGRIHQHHVINPVIRDDAQNLIDQIAMRVEHRHPFAVLDVLLDQVEQQGRFAGAG